MKTIKISDFLNIDPEEESLKQDISTYSLPENIKKALRKALQECQDGYCQSYIRALPKAYRFGKQINDIESALRSQLHYIYANMESYGNEEVKNTLADFLGIPLKDRWGAEDELV